MNNKNFTEELLRLLPYWHYRIDKPFKAFMKDKMSLETYYCLETVKRCGAITMTNLARELKVPKQQVTKLIDKLSEYQFVERVSNERDRRSVRIQLTPKASAYLDEYYLKNRVFIQMLEEQLTEEELQRLNEAARVLNEILPKLK